MTTKIVFHGSDIEKICEYYHLNKEDIVKFGANVNPLGLSSKVRDALASNIDLFSSYPDRNYTSLRNTISEYCNIPADFILPGNGSSELISLLIQERAPKHTLILGPTYSEYSRELSFSGSTTGILSSSGRTGFLAWILMISARRSKMVTISLFSVILTTRLPLRLPRMNSVN